MRTIFAFAIYCVFAVSSAFAQTGSTKTQSQLNAEIGANSCSAPGCLIPDQGFGQVTPYNMRQSLLDLTATLFSGGGAGAVTGPSSSISGNLVFWNNATGTLLANSTIPASELIGVSPLQYPYGDGNSPTTVGAGINSGPSYPTLNQNLTLINNGVYPFRIFAENNLAIGASGSTVACSGGTGASSCGGLTFSANISWSGQSAIPISYTGLSTDTPSTVKVSFCNALLANTTLVNTGSFVCDPTVASGGTFNISWDARLASVVVSSTGSGTFTPGTPANAANRDGVQITFDHYTPSYTPQAGDQNVCFALGSQGAVTELNICDYTIATGGSYQSGARFETLYNGGSAYVSMLMANGLSLPDVNNNTPAYQGFGTIALPNVGAIYMNGTKSISQSGDGNYTWLNGVDGGTLFVSGTVEYEWLASAFAPTTTNNNTLGTSSLRWSDVYSVLGNYSGIVTLADSSTYGPSGIAGTTINNSAIGGSTPAAGAFTNLSSSGTVSGTGFSSYLASPPAIGGSAASAITGTTINATTGFKANGTSGVSQTCTVNQAKTLVFTDGILTGGTCNS